MGKLTLAWILAVVITLTAAYYQKVTGPTYPKKASFEFNGKKYSFRLPRTSNSGKGCEVRLKTDNNNLKAKLFYHRFKINESYDTIDFAYNAEKKALIAELPSQPPAGKLQYFLEIQEGQNSILIASENPVVIRFKGAVPAGVLIPHILFMFFAMLTSTLTGILVLFKHAKYKLYMWLTLGLLFAGGLVLGPIVQHYAFDAYWTGIPFGWDLTDNKLLIGFLVWLVAALLNIKKDRPWLAFAASLILIVVYSIPHSMFGSELNYTTGKVMTGK